MRERLLLIAVLLFSFASGLAAAPDSAEIRVLIIDGQNNHQWQVTTPVLKNILENTGRFVVNIRTTPSKGVATSHFSPDFDSYDVVLSNYNGEDWPAATRVAFERFVRNGGGFVVYHAADNSFPDWPEYNRMIGLGGWGGRNEKDGPYLRWKDRKVVRDNSPGPGGSHGQRHEYVIENRAPEHPIMKGLPARWLHSRDELYDRLRGPAENLEVLATAHSDPGTGGTGQEEPMLMTIQYGKGRVFHTVLGDNILPLANVGFQVTLARGTEWAATGKVTIPVPPQFPTATRIVSRDAATPYLRDGVYWRPLFNGKDLTGWKQVNGTAQYKVIGDEGVLVGTTAKGSPNSFLATEQEFGDFDLKFEVKLDNPELNSGVQVRSHQYDSKREINAGGQTFTVPKGRVFGYQVEIEASADPRYPDSDFGDAGWIYDEARRGWLFDDTQRSDSLKRSAFINDHWNQYYIRCRADRIETWINGVKIAELKDDKDPRGRIMLQVHMIPENKGPWSVRWRNIQIRELDSH
jgi:type 1 glutamine amidotransferase